MKADRLKLDKTNAILERAKRRVPVCSQVFSKSPRYFVQGVYPTFIEKGLGSHIWDPDGNEYIDYLLALGPVTLGYRYPRVEEAVRKQMESGMIFALPHPLEVEVAELLCEVIPSAEMARFLKTGSEADSAAVRIARAYTGRNTVLYASYHGWHEWYSVTTSRSKGIPPVLKQYVEPFEYNDLASLEQAFAKHPGDVAAVIMEPVVLEEPRDNFLQKVKSMCEQEGAVLIFDEVVTGFRWALGGAQSYYGVTPHLTVLGKGIANGMPLSAVVGQKDLMMEFEDVFVSSTFGGETLSLAAAKATITEMMEKDVCGRFWAVGNRLKQAFVGTPRPFETRVLGCAPHFKFELLDREGQNSPLLTSIFLQECIRRGVLFHFGGVNVCYSHTDEDIERTIDVIHAALDVVTEAVNSGNPEGWLDGTPYAQVFRRN